jgi:uncharacterized OsmC-like protein
LAIGELSDSHLGVIEREYEALRRRRAYQEPRLAQQFHLADLSDFLKTAPSELRFEINFARDMVGEGKWKEFGTKRAESTIIVDGEFTNPGAKGNTQSIVKMNSLDTLLTWRAFEGPRDHEHAGATDAYSYTVMPRSTNTVKLIPDLTVRVLELEQRRTKLGGDIGTVRVDLRNVEQLRFQAHSEGFEVVVDEPTQRGGTNKGLHPLGYFILGAASCFLTQFARVAIIRKLKIDTMEMTARAHYDRTKLRRFTDIIYDVRLTGDESRKKVLDLLHEAENRCFAHQSLRQSVPLTTNLSLNGTLITSSIVSKE